MTPTSNHAMERTATRRAFTFTVAATFRFDPRALSVAVAHLVLVRPKPANHT
jgi:hypothetical protein